jgi:hypothetical protein
MAASDSCFSWSLDEAAIYLADVTTLDNFKAGILTYPMGPSSPFAWAVGSNNAGNVDCAMKVSEDGVYMYVYVVYANSTLGCIRVDCLDK